MTVTVTPANGPWVGALTCPADTEALTSASVTTFVQPIANELEFLRQRVPGANPSASLIQSWIPMSDAELVLSSTIWRNRYVPGTGGRPEVENFGLGNEDFLIAIAPPVGAVIRSMVLFCQGGPAHASLPAVMPKLDLVKIPWIGSTGLGLPIALTVVDSASDASASTAAFQVLHTIGKNLTETVSLANQYFLRVTSENGANAAVGFLAVAAAITVSA